MVARVRSARASETSFKKGHKKVGGREKGVPNKTTRVLKEAVLLAAEAVGADGKGREGLLGYLKQIARKDHKTFTQLLLKVMPLQVAHEMTGKDGGPIEVKDVREEIERRIASAAAKLTSDQDTTRLH